MRGKRGRQAIAGPATEFIRDGDDILAIIIRSHLDEPGLHFPTPKEYNLQVGVHIRPAGEVIAAHVHKSIAEPVDLPIQEFLYVERGRLRVDLFDREEELFSTVEVGAGDSILLLMGHKIELLEDTKIIEVKQGPYQTRGKDKRPLKGMADDTSL